MVNDLLVNNFENRLHMLKECAEHFKVSPADNATDLERRTKLMARLPESYRVFLSLHSKVTADGLKVLSRAEMEKLTKFVHLPTGSASGDREITTDHLVAFAKAGDESAWCFRIDCDGEMPVYYFHQDNPPAKFASDGNWLNPIHAVPQFSSFADWFELCVLDVVVNDSMVSSFDEPSFNWPDTAKLFDELRARYAAEAKKPKKGAFEEFIPTRVESAFKSIDGSTVSHDIYEMGLNILLHHRMLRPNTTAWELRAERRSFGSADEAHAFVVQFMQTKQAEGFELVTPLEGTWAAVQLKDRNKDIKKGFIVVVE
jgi:hypothetical protein